MTESILDNNTGDNNNAGNSAGNAPEWFSQIPEDIRNEPSLKSIKDIGSLAKSYVSAQKMVGAEKIVIPGKNATDQDWQGVFRKLGLPESPEKYDVKLPEGATAEEKFLSGFKAQAHKAGILPSQAEKLLGWYFGELGQRKQSMDADQEKAITDGIDGLKKEWADKFDAKLGDAKLAAKQILDDEQKKFFHEKGIDRHPQVIRLFEKLRAFVKEDHIPNSGNVGSGGMTKEEAQTKVNTILRDMKHPYHNSTHEDHKKAVEEVMGLFQMLGNS